MQERGLVYSALRSSPWKICCTALIPPHPGQGKPVIALNGQAIRIGILSKKSIPKNTNPNIKVMIINNL